MTSTHVCRIQEIMSIELIIDTYTYTHIYYTWNISQMPLERGPIYNISWYGIQRREAEPKFARISIIYNDSYYKHNSKYLA